jgi:hypothetical protein
VKCILSSINAMESQPDRQAGSSYYDIGNQSRFQSPLYIRVN